MLHLSKTAGYAIHAMGCIGAALPHPSFVHEVAQCTGLKQPYLAKIINLLAHHGLVQSKRGSRGGITLGRSAAKISLYQIVMAVEGTETSSECLFGLDECPSKKPCPAHAQWQKMRGRVEALLRKTSLQAVMKTGRAYGKLNGAERMLRA